MEVYMQIMGEGKAEIKVSNNFLQDVIPDS